MLVFVQIYMSCYVSFKTKRFKSTFFKQWVKCVIICLQYILSVLLSLCTEFWRSWWTCKPISRRLWQQCFTTTPSLSGCRSYWLQKSRRCLKWQRLDRDCCHKTMPYRWCLDHCKCPKRLLSQNNALQMMSWPLQMSLETAVTKQCPTDDVLTIANVLRDCCHKTMPYRWCLDHCKCP